MYILVVDDSAVAQLLLRNVLTAAGHTVLQAYNGHQALELLKYHQPDMITMDVHMPGINGYETIARILELYALPVIVLTASANARATTTAMQALAAGALTVVEKPSGPAAPGFDRQINQLLRTLTLMKQISVAKRSRPTAMATASIQTLQSLAAPAVIAIAASAGGPAALKILLPSLAANVPWPIILVQHIATGFLDSFVDWLQQLSTLSVQIARHGQALLPGHIYLPPEGFQLEADEWHKVKVCPANPTDLNIPSANRLFESLACNWPQQVIAIQLSGMGQDGAKGIQAVAQSGGLCIVQDPQTALIDSMPNAALCSAHYVLSPLKIAGFLNDLIKNHLPARVPKETQ